VKNSNNNSRNGIFGLAMIINNFLTACAPVKVDTYCERIENDDFSVEIISYELTDLEIEVNYPSNVDELCYVLKANDPDFYEEGCLDVSKKQGVILMRDSQLPFAPFSEDTYIEFTAHVSSGCGDKFDSDIYYPMLDKKEEGMGSFLM
jgi:hypothetical protein